jgi:hypothetical protein
MDIMAFVFSMNKKCCSSSLFYQYETLLLTHVLISHTCLQYVKCGFAGENFPTSVFPCVVGRPLLRYEESLQEQEVTVCVQISILMFLKLSPFLVHLYSVLVFNAGYCGWSGLC